MAFVNRLTVLTLQTLIGVLLSLYLAGASYIIYVDHFSEWAKQEHIKQIYYKIVKVTGQANLLPPFKVVQSQEVNAYATEGVIVVYSGLADFVKNDDEMALILAHEVAHVILRHMSTPEEDTDETRKKEADADKYGAILMMQAGYDLCKGREFWRHMASNSGDRLIQDHPDYAYRYSQLNVGCDR